MSNIEDLKTYIKKNNITKKGFAEMIGIDPVTLYRYLHGKSKIPLPTKKLIFNLTKGEVNLTENNDENN